MRIVLEEPPPKKNFNTKDLGKQEMLTKITMLRAQPRCFLHRPANAMHWPKMRPLMLVPVPGNKHPFAATLCTAAKTDQTPQLEVNTINLKVISFLNCATSLSDRK